MRPSGAGILRSYLTGLGLLTPAAGAWPSVVGMLPPDQPAVVALVDTAPKREGRAHGEVVFKPRLTVLVRGPDYPTALDRAVAIEAACTKVGVPPAAGGAGTALPVPYRGRAFALCAAHVVVAAAYLGQETDTRRSVFSINVQLSVREVG